MPVGMASGKFQGAMTTPTPRGWYVGVRLARPSSTCAPAPSAIAPAPVVLAEVDRLAHLGVGLGDRLARLADAQPDELVASPPQHGGGAEQHRGPVAPRRRPPVGRGGHRHRAVRYVVDAGRRAAADLDVGPSRVDGGERRREATAAPSMRREPGSRWRDP